MPTTQEVIDAIADHQLWLADPQTGARLDLRNEDLTLVDSDVFFEKDLREGRFNNAILTSKDFRGADCRQANFRGAAMQDCLMLRGRFNQCTFINTNLRRVCGHHSAWNGANFTGANFRETDMTYGDFAGCNFTDAIIARGREDRGLDPPDFSHSQMTNCTFVDTNTRRAIMEHVDLTGSTMTNGPFRHTVFSHAVLVNVALTDPDFTAAIFKSARIGGSTNFASANLDEAVVQYTTLATGTDKYEPKESPEERARRASKGDREARLQKGE